MNLEYIYKFLDENGPCFLATLGTCGNPRLRPMQSPLLFDNKIYFCTSNTKGLFKHIKNHNGIEFCNCNKEGTFLRLRANAIFEDNKIVKEAMFKKYPSLKNLYESPENPNFEVFYLANLSARKQGLDNSFESFKE
ncbi:MULTISPECIES: pyridoxamine 5'-phosphate oxidase family protein [unclassified Campylobacter]|uniref:pyridoxamine 5'-phosphate oxidase family protein n=1 Tax=unclassified Campylobacter TaxID=2593542 RepID=UPI00123826B3|nr:MULTISPECIES: pyridoxamine 5'-phosphate oxidase family protein [unclassified Campylobacter]KAA6229921.1 pyridoxamine 5'-phosphate oxidase [Campylobacter sp. LR286c]KAA6234445.1 pyridoxamine 5'-phosphate oxidase [Campylobacter sp. LR264d]